MGQAKAKRAFDFSEADIRRWEADDCLNFANALARRSDRLLHVGWLTQMDQGDQKADDEPKSRAS